MKKRKPIISVLVPVYNEASNLVRLDAEVRQGMLQAKIPFEIIYIDDGSKDHSAQLISSFASNNHDNTFGIYFARNFGQTAALMAGIQKSTAGIIVPLDSDLQNVPADIPRLVARLEEGYDLVSGYRQHRQDQPITRNFPSWVANRIINFLFGIDIKDFGCSLKAYRASYLRSLELYGEMHRYLPILVHFQGGRITNLAVGHRKRIFGKSKYGLGRIPKVILDLLLLKFLLDGSHKPLHWFGVLGFLSFSVSFGSGALAIYLRMAKNVSFILTPLPLLTAFTFITGLIFVSFGVLSEIMVRIYYGSTGKPYFREKIPRGQ